MARVCVERQFLQDGACGGNPEPYKILDRYFEYTETHTEPNGEVVTKTHVGRIECRLDYRNAGYNPCGGCVGFDRDLVTAKRFKSPQGYDEYGYALPPNYKYREYYDYTVACNNLHLRPLRNSSAAGMTWVGPGDPPANPCFVEDSQHFYTGARGTSYVGSNSGANNWTDPKVYSAECTSIDGFGANIRYLSSFGVLYTWTHLDLLAVVMTPGSNGNNGQDRNWALWYERNNPDGKYDPHNIDSIRRYFWYHAPAPPREQDEQYPYHDQQYTWDPTPAPGSWVFSGYGQFPLPDDYPSWLSYPPTAEFQAITGIADNWNHYACKRYVVLHYLKVQDRIAQNSLNVPQPETGIVGVGCPPGFAPASGVTRDGEEDAGYGSFAPVPPAGEYPLNRANINALVVPSYNVSGPVTPFLQGALKRRVVANCYEPESSGACPPGTSSAGNGRCNILYQTPMCNPPGSTWDPVRGTCCWEDPNFPPGGEGLDHDRGFTGRLLVASISEGTAKLYIYDDALPEGVESIVSLTSGASYEGQPESESGVAKAISIGSRSDGRIDAVYINQYNYCRLISSKDIGRTWSVPVTLATGYTNVLHDIDEFGLILLLHREGNWYCRVAVKDDAGAWVVSDPERLVTAGSQYASFKVRPDKTKELVFRDGDGATKLMLCKDLKSDGTGTWVMA